MRGVLATILAAGLMLALALTASGAQPELRPGAVALVADGGFGAQGGAYARRTRERKREGGVAVPGLTVANGEAIARTSAEDGTAHAAAVARTVSVLDGRVTAYGVRRVADATVDGIALRGRIEGLEIDGRRIGTVSDSASYPLADGTGRVVVNRGANGLRVVLDTAAGAYPAGTDIRVAVADASVRRVPTKPNAEPSPSPSPTRGPAPTATAAPEGDREKTATPRKTGLTRRAAPEVPKRLTRAGFAFPVHGEASFSDDFGAPRQPVVGTHQGNDIFAEFGAPVLAVTNGVVSRVGTLEISGNRLWLTSDSGDAFFYAHLSAFSPAAVDGRRVKAGTVLGFVGNTGDAEPTPPHVHFEIHPGGMEEGPVNPFPILTAWQGRRDVPAGAWLQEYGPDATERPGALVAVRDFIAE